jgi:hypothetical protein
METQQETQYNPNFRILWAELQAHPAVPPPFILRLGVQSTPYSGLLVLNDVMIYNAINLPDAMAKLFAYMEKTQIQLAEDFALVYPLYQGEGELKADIDYLASAVAEEAIKRQWNFERKLPQPTWWDNQNQTVEPSTKEQV